MVIKRIFSLAIIIIIAFSCFVFADVLNSNAGGPFSTNEDVSFQYNITINNTDITRGINFTQISINLPSGFSYVADSSGSSSAIGSDFTSNSGVLSWTNNSGLIFNGTFKYFWFNAIASNPGMYNVTISTLDTSSKTNSTNISIQINDSTAPVINIIYPVNGTNYSLSSVNFNLTLSDNINISSCWYTLTNGDLNTTMTLNSTLTVANATNSSIINGIYTAKFYCNDTSNNLNDTSQVTFKLDSVFPLITAVSSSVTSTTSLISWNTSEYASSTVYYGTTNATTSTTTNSSYLNRSSVYLTGLTSSTVYYYNISSCDYASNCNRSIQYTFTTSASSSSDAGSSSNNANDTTDWIITYYPYDSQLAEGYSQNLILKSRIKVPVNGSDHYIGVVGLTNTDATINVFSTPQQAIFSIGNEKKFDVTSDGYYDISIKLVNITNSRAQLIVKRIYEVVPVTANQGSSGTTAQNGSKGSVLGTAAGTETTKSNLWIWIAIGAGVVIIIAGAVLFIIYRKK